MKILIKSISNPEVPYPEEPEKKNISAYFKYDERHNCYYIMIVVIQELVDFFEDIEKPVSSSLHRSSYYYRMILFRCLFLRCYYYYS